MDDNVATLTAHTIGAFPQLAIEDNAAAYACAECQHTEGAYPQLPSEAEPILGQRRQVRVPPHRNFSTETAFKSGPHLKGSADCGCVRLAVHGDQVYQLQYRRDHILRRNGQ
jgi:hypothetical protein